MSRSWWKPGRFVTLKRAHDEAIGAQILVWRFAHVEDCLVAGPEFLRQAYLDRLAVVERRAQPEPFGEEAQDHARIFARERSEPDVRACPEIAAYVFDPAAIAHALPSQVIEQVEVQLFAGQQRYGLDRRGLVAEQRRADDQRFVGIVEEGRDEAYGNAVARRDRDNIDCKAAVFTDCNKRFFRCLDR